MPRCLPTTLRKGATGPDVQVLLKYLERRCQRRPSMKGVIPDGFIADEVYGSKAVEFVQALQRKWGLAGTGVVGETFYAKIPLAVRREMIRTFEESDDGTAGLERMRPDVPVAAATSEPGDKIVAPGADGNGPVQTVSLEAVSDEALGLDQLPGGVVASPPGPGGFVMEATTPPTGNPAAVPADVAIDTGAASAFRDDPSADDLQDEPR